MEILDKYLTYYNYKIYRDEAAHNIYMDNIILCEDMCGEMSDQLDSLVATYDKDEDTDAIILLITDANNIPVAIFHGTFQNNELVSNITCSTTKLKRGGVLLRFYALLIANKLDNKVTKLTGGISGGIPPLMPGDSSEVEQEKKQRLHDYHLKNGATIDENNEFIYNLDNVKNKIEELFVIKSSGGGSRKTKRRRMIKKRTIKKRRQYSRRK